jgi:hypothetical protein
MKPSRVVPAVLVLRFARWSCRIWSCLTGSCHAGSCHAGAGPENATPNGCGPARCGSSWVSSMVTRSLRWWTRGPHTFTHRSVSRRRAWWRRGRDRTVLPGPVDPVVRGDAGHPGSARSRWPTRGARCAGIHAAVCAVILMGASGHWPALLRRASLPKL